MALQPTCLRLRRGYGWVSTLRFELAAAGWGIAAPVSGGHSLDGLIFSRRSWPNAPALRPGPTRTAMPQPPVCACRGGSCLRVPPARQTRGRHCPSPPSRARLPWRQLPPPPQPLAFLLASPAAFSPKQSQCPAAAGAAVVPPKRGPSQWPVPVSSPLLPGAQLHRLPALWRRPPAAR